MKSQLKLVKIGAQVDIVRSAALGTCWINGETCLILRTFEPTYDLPPDWYKVATKQLEDEVESGSIFVGVTQAPQLNARTGLPGLSAPVCLFLERIKVPR